MISVVFRRGIFMSLGATSKSKKTNIRPLDNTYQTMIDPKQLNKSVKKFTMTPSEFESIHDDPFLRRFKIFSPQFYNDMARYPDHDELLIDLKTFEVKSYLKYLFSTKWDDLDPKDEFLYRVIQVYILFMIHIIVKEALFYFYEDNSDSINLIEGGGKSKLGMPQKESHFNYKEFEKEFDYNMLLFTRSIKRIKNEIDID